MTYSYNPTSDDNNQNDNQDTTQDTTDTIDTTDSVDVEEVIDQNTGISYSYTEDEDANTIFLTPASLQASKIFAVPVTLFSAYKTGSAIDWRTPANAAI